jgi:hypothetical protein
MQVFLLLFLRDPDERTKPVVDGRPVDQRNITGIATFGIVPTIEDAAVVPEIARMRALRRAIEDRERARLKRFGIVVGPAKLGSRPERSLIAAPEVVILRPGDRVILVGKIVHREAPAYGLLVQRLCRTGDGVRLSSLSLALGADHVLDVGQRQEIA